MSTLTTRDGTDIFYKDWGPRRGQPIVFSHGWPLSADAWDIQMVFLGERGHRVVAHDRRGHGRSAQTWTGNDMDTYADDLAALIEELNLRDIVLGAYMRDIDRAMVLDSSGHYERPPNGSEHFDAQQFLIRHYTDTLGEP